MTKLPELSHLRLAVVGLGYVGLPLAVEFGKRYPTVGFDINQTRVEQLVSGEDRTLEVTAQELKNAIKLSLTTDLSNISNCNVYIITVPTPIDQFKRPELSALQSASAMVGKVLNPGNLVIYESTVYPGATEEICVPILEEKSQLVFNQDFWCGYSPERINPGDKAHRLTTIVKVTSGSTSEAADLVDDLYQSIVTAGTHRASSIRVAEAAKVIENTQRDVNIALINELALIFNRLGIDTLEVLEAAGTKWNFLPFRPGLVGGHCIGVDPYYLTHKAQQVGYHPEVILSGRRINDSMGCYVAGQIVRQLIQRRIEVVDARVLVLGLTFKENCPDLRNTRVVDLITELTELNILVEVYDPWANELQAKQEYGIELISFPTGVYDAIAIAVAHDHFLSLVNEEIQEFLKPNGFVYDLKGLAEKKNNVLRL
ncbi:MAG: nucleotide sugar dehydrogenase [Cyanobacteria bacterium REEB494]|nr:nucleotide sugar dehydrogenase [Cyanobacteria bacterium REEB494]